MISIYCDGSSTGRVGPGGWAWVITKDGEPLFCGSGGGEKETNNTMELTAAIKGLEAYKDKIQPKEEFTELVSDSQYTLGIASGEYKPSANLKLALRLRELVKEIGCTVRWVRGHSGDVWNTRCDSLAKSAKDQFVKKKS